jgi:DNA-binding response OmpR family regulator
MAAKLLVVDDDPKWLRVASLYLRARDYQVETALSGDDALQKVSESLPDVVIADIGMPGMDGYDLCSHLRRDPKTRALPFIFLTARDQDQDRIKARKIGSDDYLTKPCPLERLTQSVETVLDRIETARGMSLDRIGLSGRIEDVDLLDLIQTLEMEQRTGALVLSHGERTGTLYFNDGSIVHADIRSPKREEPLFVLLGWKTGRFLFLPDAAPEQMPVTASMANLLFQDLRTLEEHEQASLKNGTGSQWATGSGPAQSNQPAQVDGDLARPVQMRLEEIARKLRGRQPATPGPPIARLRILVAGVARSGAGELIQSLLQDLSGSRWVALGIEEASTHYKTEVGRVRIAHDAVLHLIAIRTEKRFWPLWEQCLPGALGVLLLVDPASRAALDHARAFLKARDTLAPALPVQAILPLHASPAELSDLDSSHLSVGSPDNPTVRLTALEQVILQWLGVN